MHPLLLDDVIALCRRRLAQGDSPTEQPASVETLENAVIQLADTLASGWAGWSASRRWTEAERCR